VRDLLGSKRADGRCNHERQPVARWPVPRDRYRRGTDVELQGCSRCLANNGNGPKDGRPRREHSTVGQGPRARDAIFDLAKSGRHRDPAAAKQARRCPQPISRRRRLPTNADRGGMQPDGQQLGEPLSRQRPCTLPSRAAIRSAITARLQDRACGCGSVRLSHPSKGLLAWLRGRAPHTVVTWCRDPPSGGADHRGRGVRVRRGYRSGLRRDDGSPHGRLGPSERPQRAFATDGVAVSGSPPGRTCSADKSNRGVQGRQPGAHDRAAPCRSCKDRSLNQHRSRPGRECASETGHAAADLRETGGRDVEKRPDAVPVATVVAAGSARGRVECRADTAPALLACLRKHSRGPPTPAAGLTSRVRGEVASRQSTEASPCAAAHSQATAVGLGGGQGARTVATRGQPLGAGRERGLRLCHAKASRAVTCLPRRNEGRWGSGLEGPPPGLAAALALRDSPSSGGRKSDYCRGGGGADTTGRSDQ